MAAFNDFEKPVRPDYPDSRGEDYSDRGGTGPGPGATTPGGANGDYQADFVAYAAFRTAGAGTLAATADPVKAGQGQPTW